MKERELKILSELIKGSRRSDRQLAKVTGLSQPTVTRTRTKLEKMGLVKEYTIIPNLREMGYELLVFTFMSFVEDKPELFDKAREWIKNQPSVIFANNGLGAGMNSMMLSVHRDYADYADLVRKLKQDWEPNLANHQSFVVALGQSDLTIRDFSFRHLLRGKEKKD
jgi:DNA-binding Lrp family transcriptional regulator